MIFTARIPKEIVFSLAPVESFEIQKWLEYPELKSKVLKSNHNMIHPFVVSGEKGKEKYKDDEQYKIYSNKPVEIKFLGYYNKKAMVLIDNKFVHSISFDVLLNSLTKKPLGVNGKLPGKYVFAIINKKYTPVIYKSELYYKILKLQNVNSIPNNDLKVGGIYKTKSQNIAIFLGFATTEFAQKANKNLGTNFSNISFKQEKLVTLWYKLSVFTNHSRFLNEDGFEGLINEKGNLIKLIGLSADSIATANKNYFLVCKKHPFVTKITKRTADIPENFIKTIRNKIYTSIKREVFLAKNYNTFACEKQPNDALCKKVIQVSPTLNMTMFGLGTDRSDIFDYIQKELIE